MITYRALNRDVLAVAVTEEDVGDWAAYIGAVPGNNHEEEAELVARNGGKLPHKMAAILFPQIDEKYIWRD